MRERDGNLGGWGILREKANDGARTEGRQRRPPRYVQVNNRSEGNTPLTVQALSEMLRS